MKRRFKSSLEGEFLRTRALKQALEKFFVKNSKAKFGEICEMAGLFEEQAVKLGEV
jgi:hypothetical protein